MFESLISSLEQSACAVSTPQSFKRFLASEGLQTSKRTPEIISINGLSDLQPELRENSYTILRLGKPDDDKTTQFSLVKLPSLSDGFFLDQPIFDSAGIGNFIPETSLRSLYPYHLLPKLTESSLLNLALSSGILAEALDIDPGINLGFAAGGNTSYTFDFHPLSTSPIAVKHNRGQVEIDSMFVARRQGQECLFVIEAKVGVGDRSLAKQKLLYPALGLRDLAPNWLVVVPVYLRIIKDGSDNYVFNMAECTNLHPGSSISLDTLTTLKVRRNRLVIPS